MNVEIQNAFKIWALNGNSDVHDGYNGPGSTMWYTEPLRKKLASFLKKYNIRSMLDAPCGDFTWMSKIEFGDGFDYLGADLHPDMIERNNRMYSKNFTVLDITEDYLPPKDLMFVRDCLFHFSDILKLKFFLNFLESDFKYLLTSNHPKHKQNEDLGEFGNFFVPVNFEISPWFFPEPIDFIIDYDISDERFLSFPYRTMCLWTKQQIQESVSKFLKHRINPLEKNLIKI